MTLLRADESTELEQGIKGIGLYVASNIVGYITRDSKPGLGRNSLLFKNSSMGF